MSYKTLPPTLSGSPDYSLLPEHMRDGLERYYWDGIPPGGFMTSVLANELYQACARADTINRNRLIDIVNFMVWHMPAHCWGSPKTVAEWIMIGGEHGRLNQKGERAEDSRDTS